jgi:hypothetical protein
MDGLQVSIEKHKLVQNGVARLNKRKDAFVQNDMSVLSNRFQHGKMRLAFKSQPREHLRPHKLLSEFGELGLVFSQERDAFHEDNIAGNFLSDA